MCKSELKLKSNRIFFDNFNRYIKTRNYKGLTNYTTPVFEFLSWIEEHGVLHIKDLTTDILNQYFQHLYTRPNKRLGGTLSQSTINDHKLALTLLFEMLLSDNVITKAYVFPTFTTFEGKTREILTVDEVKEVLNVCRNLFERNIINLAYGCGLRRVEIVRLNVQDVFFQKGYLVVTEGKNSKRREVPLTESISKDLREYIITDRPKLLKGAFNKETAFLVNANGERSNGGTLNRRLIEIIDRTGDPIIMKKVITLHCLRHSIATHLHEAGAGIEFIRDFLGHSEIDTTTIYLVRRKKRLVLI